MQVPRKACNIVWANKPHATIIAMLQSGELSHWVLLIQYFCYLTAMKSDVGSLRAGYTVAGFKKDDVRWWE